MKPYAIDPDWVEETTLKAFEQAYIEANQRRLVFGASLVFRWLSQGTTGEQIVRHEHLLRSTEKLKRSLSAIIFHPHDLPKDALPPISKNWQEIAKQIGDSAETEGEPLNAVRVAGIILSRLNSGHALITALFPGRADLYTVVIQSLQYGHLASSSLAPDPVIFRKSHRALGQDEAEASKLCWKDQIKPDADERPFLVLVWFGQHYELKGHAARAVNALYESYFAGEEFVRSGDLMRKMRMVEERPVAGILAPGGAVLKSIRGLVRFRDGKWSMILPEEHFYFFD